MKHRVEFLPDYTETLTKLYQSDEFNPGQLIIEVKLAFALDDFNYIVQEIDLMPKLRLKKRETYDDRLKSMMYVGGFEETYAFSLFQIIIYN